MAVDVDAASARRIDTHYVDPLALIWTRAAGRLGYRVIRSTEVFAAFDGINTITVSAASEFDPDDNVGQMLFHELCHAMVAGPVGRRLPDWGLSNTDSSGLQLEQATNRLQAALAARHGLRGFFATTTEHRAYYDGLPADALLPADDPAARLARQALDASDNRTFCSVLLDALRHTRALAEVMRPLVTADSLWARVDDDPSE